MSDECDNYGEHALGCTCWKESKKELPRLGEVIEGIGPKNWFYTNLGRDYFALVEVNQQLIWISPSMTDFDYNTLDITHWRYLLPNPRGKKPFVRIKKYKGWWEPKVYFKREN
jgi:hypothetical protein